MLGKAAQLHRQNQVAEAMRVTAKFSPVAESRGRLYNLAFCSVKRSDSTKR